MEWQKVPRDDLLFEGADPYFQLRTSIQTSGAFALPGRSALRPLIVLLQGRDAAWFDDQPGVQVPPFYTDPILGLEHARWHTALADQRFFESLKRDDKLRSAIARIAVLPPIVPQVDGSDAAIGEDAGEPFPYADDATVVIGIIDYGIAFAHERFRHSELKSRVEYLWVQDARSAPSQSAGLSEGSQAVFTLSEPAGSQQAQVDVHAVPYGREIRAGNINHLLSSGGRFVDEDAIYRMAAAQLGRRWLRSVSRRVAHGTHVMDLACGYDLTERERTQRPIICVQLPEATTADTSGENLDAYALDGIRYILERADEIARRAPPRTHLPVVINFSFGNVAGPHDGTSDLEQAIDEIIQERGRMAPLEVVIPSGNSHLARLHAQITFNAVAPDDPEQLETDRSDRKKFGSYRADLHWRVLPDDRTPSFLEIWLPRNPPGQSKAKSRVALDITFPGGSRSDPLDETAQGAGVQLVSDDGAVFCEARYRFVGPPTNRGMFLVALQPTKSNERAWPGQANPVAPSGTWTVSLVNTGLGKEPVEAWIQRDDTPYGFPRRGRQSYLDHACYERFDHRGRVIEDDSKQKPCIIKRAGSMNAIATGKETLVVGGYVGTTGKPASYSAGGPATERWPRRGPDAVAVSDESLVLRGVLAAGTRSGSVVTLDGTSVAAPQATRMKADEVAGKGRARNPEKPEPIEPAEPPAGIERTGKERVERLRRSRVGR